MANIKDIKENLIEDIKYNIEEAIEDGKYEKLRNLLKLSLVNVNSFTESLLNEALRRSVFWHPYEPYVLPNQNRIDTYYNICKLLIDHGANVNSIDCKHSDYPDTCTLEFAAGTYILDFVKLIIKNGANQKSKNKALYRIIGYDKPELIDNSVIVDIAKYLIKHGANPNAVYDNNTCLFMYARWWDSIELGKLLLDSGADPNFKSVRSGKSVVEILITYQSNPNLVLPILKMMINKGAIITDEMFHKLEQKNKEVADIIKEYYINTKIITHWYMHSKTENKKLPSELIRKLKDYLQFGSRKINKSRRASRKSRRIKRSRKSKK
jgi:ankyrin repeat protein